MTDFLAELPTWVRAVVPTLTAVVGLATAVTTASRGTVLRKRAEALRAEIEAASRPHDKEVLQSLHRDVTADIVALLAAPTRKRILALARYFLGIAVAVPAGFLMGVVILLLNDPSPPGSLNPLTIGFLSVLLAVFSLASLIVGISDWFKSRLELLRVADAYLKGRTVDRKLSNCRGVMPSAEILDEVKESEHTSGRSVWWHLLGVVASMSFFPWFVLVSTGAAFAISGDWMLLTQAGSAMVLVLLMVLHPLTFLIIRTASSRVRVPDAWVHPRPLSPEDQVQAEVAEARGSPAGQHRRRWALFRPER